jgi:flagellar hook-associated protein 3 FlgL
MMRVTQSEIYRNFLSDIQGLNESLSQLSKQASSGKKLTQLKDSPAGSADLTRLSELAAKIDQYISNADDSHYFLGVADSALNEVNNLVVTIYTKGSQAASESVNSDARSTISAEIRSLREQIVSIANSQARGRYIFSGSKVSSAPFSISGDSVLYQGDSDVNTIHIDTGTEVTQGVSGSEAFSSIFASIEELLAGVDGNDTVRTKAALSQFSAALSQLGQARGKIGADLSLLENVQSNLKLRTTSVQEQRGQVEDANMAEVIVQLNQAKTALDAAVSAGGSMFSQRNLFDILG